jgi:hypothetical protein
MAKTKLYIKVNDKGTMVSLKRGKFPMFDHFLDTQFDSIQEGYSDLLVDESEFSSLVTVLPISEERAKYGISVFLDDSFTIFCTLSTMERDVARQEETKRRQEELIKDAREGYDIVLEKLKDESLSEEKRESLMGNKKDFESYLVSIGETIEPQLETETETK